MCIRDRPSAFDPAKKDGNLSAQIISQERPVSETAALNPDWVEWLMGFPKGWTLSLIHIYRSCHLRRRGKEHPP